MDKIYLAKSSDDRSLDKSIKKRIRAEQINEYLEKGWEIYEREVNSTAEELIAEPESGFLKEIKIPVQSQTIMIGKV